MKGIKHFKLCCLDLKKIIVYTEWTGLYLTSIYSWRVLLMDNGWLLYLPGFLPLDAGVACFAQSRSPGYKLPITAVTDTGAGAGEGGGTGAGQRSVGLLCLVC